jgi:hypothetical protein|nr:MAG TPA: hypothetical protein [Caudoviricetes sp.]
MIIENKKYVSKYMRQIDDPNEGIVWEVGYCHDLVDSAGFASQACLKEFEPIMTFTSYGEATKFMQRI